MSSSAVSIFGGSILALLLAGYLGQKYLPPPKPKIVGIDLGTTFSCIGVYHAGSGVVDVLENGEKQKCIPSIVAFSGDDILVGYKAAAQADLNSANTIYDAKRFIGKSFRKEELQREAKRYPFQLEADEFGMIRYKLMENKEKIPKYDLTPEFIGSRIIAALKGAAEANLSAPVSKAVMTVPAEFSEMQRNFTRRAAALAGIEVLRVINEPTAAALAYGIHKKPNVDLVMVIDLGGGTLDVSLLRIQGGMFSTQAMAGNNHLGGQDFNQRLMKHLLSEINSTFHHQLINPEDLQHLREASEKIKLDLTVKHSSQIKIPLHAFTLNGNVSSSATTSDFVYEISRATFEALNEDLFLKVLKPVETVLETVELTAKDIDEVVLVGGSTRIPKIRQLVREYFDMEPNYSIDPDLAVVTGVSIQAGILGGAWPLQVSATELPSIAKKIHLS